MRKGIHRGYDSLSTGKAWVAASVGEAGEWVSEEEYRKAGYLPEFEHLPSLIVQGVSAAPLRVQVYVFRTDSLAQSTTVVSVAPLDAVVFVFGGGGLKDAAGLESAFGGSAYFENEESGECFLGVWGKRNGGAFRRRMREAGISLKIAAEPPPARLKWSSKGARGTRPKVAS